MNEGDRGRKNVKEEKKKKLMLNTGKAKPMNPDTFAKSARMRGDHPPARLRDLDNRRRGRGGGRMRNCGESGLFFVLARSLFTRGRD